MSKRLKILLKILLGILIFFIVFLLALGITLQIYITQKAQTFPDIRKHIDPQVLDLNTKYQKYYEQLSYEAFPKDLIENIVGFDPFFWKRLNQKIEPNISMLFDENVLRELFFSYICKNCRIVEGTDLVSETADRLLEKSFSYTPSFSGTYYLDLLIYIAALKQFDGKEILQFYLNTQDFGNGIKGFPMAAKIKFEKNINELTKDEKTQLILCMHSSCFEDY